MKLYYRKEGEGPAVVIIHGLYGSSNNWMNMGKRLAKNHTVYMIDQRNHGRSPFAPSNSYEDMKTDLLEFFEARKMNKATLLGHSMGGKVAMWFAANFPERVQKLVIADIAPKDYLSNQTDTQYYLHQNILLAMQETDFSVVRKRKEAGDQLAEKIDNPSIRQFLLKNMTRDKKTGMYRWRLNVDVLYAYLEEIIRGVNPRWFEDRVPIFHYPVIFIRGLKSNYILPEDEKLIHSIYPDARIIDIPEAGHWLHAEQPEKFMKAVESCC